MTTFHLGPKECKRYMLDLHLNSYYSYDQRKKELVSYRSCFRRYFSLLLFSVSCVFGYVNVVYRFKGNPIVFSENNQEFTVTWSFYTLHR